MWLQEYIPPSASQKFSEIFLWSTHDLILFGEEYLNVG